jgi:signal transduction histidine kinase
MRVRGDMANSDISANIFAELRRLAVESPRDARLRVARLLDSGADSLDDVLHLASAPGEGRLRQLIANAVRNRKDKARIVPHLVRWQRAETDEFARGAIAAALVDVEPAASEPSRPADLPQVVETYRYVANRLCHRVRNSLTGPSQHLRKLEALLNGGTDAKSAEAKTAVSQLKDALRDLSRIVEFDIGDSYFQWRPIDLPAWLRSMTAQYVAKSGPLTVRIVGLDESQKVHIHANDLLLEILFWNLWKNAQQAAESTCLITVLVSLAGPNAQLLVTDNGRGFSAEDAELAFVDRFARRGANFGRGLLEVHDAAQRLGGSVQLVQMPTGEYRIQLTLPLIV